jgi:hypothetical protein
MPMRWIGVVAILAGLIADVAPLWRFEAGG